CSTRSIIEPQELFPRLGATNLEGPRTRRGGTISRLPVLRPGRNSVAGCGRVQAEECIAMLGWALTFLIVAIIAAVFGFGGIADFAVEIAKIIFFVAIILFAISAIVGLIRGRSPTVP